MICEDGQELRQGLVCLEKLLLNRLEGSWSNGALIVNKICG